LFIVSGSALMPGGFSANVQQTFQFAGVSARGHITKSSANWKVCCTSRRRYGDSLVIIERTGTAREQVACAPYTVPTAARHAGKFMRWRLFLQVRYEFSLAG
jgi:hypothetical protein